MKLILVQPYLNLMGGDARVILKIAQHYDAKIYTLEYDPNLTFKEFDGLDINVIKTKVPFSGMLPYRASQGLRYGYMFYNMKIKEDYDVLNPHISPSEWIRNKNERVVWYCHTPVREVYDLYSFRMRNRSYKARLLYAAFASAYKLISKTVIGKIEAIATNSNNTNMRIKRYFSRSATVINPGIDYRDFTNTGDQKYFFYPSRFYPNKRQDYVMDAFAKFLRKTKSLKYKLVLAGSLSKNQEHVAYFEKLKNKKVRNVVFKINISDQQLKNLYSNSTAVLFAAMNEDFGLVPLEAMSSCKPIISVNDGGPKETIVNGKTGFLVNSPNEMAERMRFIIEHKDLAERMGREGRKHVSQSYSWNLFFKKFDRLVRKVSKE